MLFILIGIIFVFIFSLKDTEQERLNKEKKDWERITGNKYI